MLKPTLPKIEKTIPLKNIKNFLKGLPYLIAQFAFEFSLALVVIALLFGGLAYFKYVVWPKAPIEQEPLRFQKEIADEILAELEDRAKEFQEIDRHEFSDPFSPRAIGD